MQSMVKISKPSDKTKIKPTFYKLNSNQNLIRIFNPHKHETKALTFRNFGPLERFDHHRSKNDQKQEDKERGIYYASLSFSCSLVEVFGDYRTISTSEHYVAIVEIIRDLQLLDLRESAAMRNGTEAAISYIPNRKLTQQWSRFFYKKLPAIDGLIYESAHNGEDCIALYERAQGALKCSPKDECSLNIKALQAPISEIAERHNLNVEP